MLLLEPGSDCVDWVACGGFILRLIVLGTVSHLHCVLVLGNLEFSVYSLIIVIEIAIRIFCITQSILNDL